ncbi:MAG: hypothetical protein LBD16_00105 [Oscillospiraceae bacterium]|jgi:hypothetical protein|nr:hypothetical protein [Oscillospiraceae bacterium]
MLRQEMNIGYFNYIHRPGEKLGVLDNASDFESCRERTHCNATHARPGPAVKWDDESGKFVLDDDGVEERLRTFNDVIKGKRHAMIGGGEHNNVYFPGFYHYRKNIPEALMRDIDGNFLELRDPDVLGGKPIPMPAIDDPTLLAIHAEQLSRQAEPLRGCHYVAGYVMGGEMLYPEYFGLGHGDYRPASWSHFEAWCEAQGVAVPDKKDTIKENSAPRNTWLKFREQAMADRCAYYYQAILAKDDTHLCFYPTHGSFMHGTSRAQLGQQSDSLISSSDGIEMGHILIDDDAERRNVLLIGYNASFGAPVIIPRLGNKTADLGMAGGGRSFTPNTLRRLVYECAGMGISVIYPIHWRSHLHDGEWLIKDTPAELECRKVFDELTLAAPYTTGMGRMQPQVGLFAADDTWLKGWNPRWTGILQDAYADRASVTVVSDAMIDEHLPAQMPVLLSVDNDEIGGTTLAKLEVYLTNGGKLLVLGKFAETADPASRESILSHLNCRISYIAETSHKRVLREMFLAGYPTGTGGPRYIYNDVNFAALRKEIESFAPEAILSPFIAEGNPKQTNIYALTDRASVLAVCVNNGGGEAVFALKPDPRLLDGDLRAIDAVTGDSVSMPITLAGYASRMIYFSVAIDDCFEETLCAAEDAYDAWREAGADIGAVRHNYSGLRSGPHKEKRLALANGILNTLAIKPNGFRGDDGSLTIIADIFDAKLNKLENAKVWLRITPGSFRRLAVTWDGASYICRVPAEELPLTYDPQSMKYTPVSGAVRIIIQAEDGARQGGCIVNTVL